MTNPLVSLVSICWNRKDDILESIKGIYEIDYDNFEIIVVDNDSSDGTQEAIESAFPHVRLIKMFKNIGIEAYNIGFKNARGEYIVILDDDSFPAQQSIKRMVQKFSQNEKLGVVAFDVRNYYQYTQVAHEKIEESKDVSPPDYLISFNGAGAGVRRALLEEVGFYPEEFFLYWNETDTAFRILSKGYQIIYFPDIVAFHKFSPKNRSSWRSPFYHTRNMFFVLWKNYPLHVIITKTFKFIYLCIYYSLEQKTFIYIKAMCNAFIKINTVLKKRNPVKDEIWKNLRISLEMSFTSFR